MIRKIQTNSPWEKEVGYSRAVRIGNQVEVSGTVAVDESGIVQGHNDPYVQTRYIFQKVEKVLHELGAEWRHVIRTRMYVVDISQWKEIGRVHGEYFGEIRPATTMVEVKALIDPSYLVEIEFTALITDE